jgi:hypothetical protein
MDDTNNLNREEVTLDVTKNILKEIKAGDLDHGLSVAEMLLSEGPNYSPELLILLIESIIELAAQAGSLDAKEYLKEKWPTLKRGHLRRLTRKTEPYL